MKTRMAKLSSVRMAETNRKHASARMKRNNPMARPSAVRKMRATLKRIGHKPVVRGGNGTPTPEPVRRLAEALGWTVEYPVRTGMGRGTGYPTCYKVDIADPERKVAVEIDGSSHNMLSRKAQDAKKNTLLSSLGWTVLRFSNEEVMANTNVCALKVLSTTSK